MQPGSEKLGNRQAGPSSTLPYGLLSLCMPVPILLGALLRVAYRVQVCTDEGSDETAMEGVDDHSCWDEHTCLHTSNLRCKSLKEPGSCLHTFFSLKRIFCLW